MVRPVLAVLSLISIIAALYFALAYAPMESSMGTIQRIFYFHVPQGILSYLSAILLGFGSLMYLIKSDLKWDRFAYSSAELGVLFSSTSIISGMIWARPVWNTWWSGDARLTLQLILALLFVGYFMLRAYLPEREKKARLSTAFGFLAALNVPINYAATRITTTLHPQPVIGPGGGGLEPQMYTALFVSFAAFGILYAYLLSERLALAKVEEEVEYLEQVVESA